MCDPGHHNVDTPALKYWDISNFDSTDGKPSQPKNTVLQCTAGREMPPRKSPADTKGFHGIVALKRVYLGVCDVSPETWGENIPDSLQTAEPQAPFLLLDLVMAGF